MSGRGAMELTPYITVKGAAAAIDFYTRVLDAKEQFRLNGEDGHIGHAELAIGDGRLMLSDESPAFGALSPLTIGGTPIRLHLYVPDVDATLRKAEAAGGTILRPAQDQFYGDRSGLFADPFGHQWFVATRKQPVSAETMQEQYTDSFKS
ncbi:MAG TPA: VOC family protein [Rhizomicrobium sp.]